MIAAPGCERPWFRSAIAPSPLRDKALRWPNVAGLRNGYPAGDLGIYIYASGLQIRCKLQEIGTAVAQMAAKGLLHIAESPPS